jgi:hypothetical protein
VVQIVLAFVAVLLLLIALLVPISIEVINMLGEVESWSESEGVEEHGSETESIQH